MVDDQFKQDVCHFLGKIHKRHNSKRAPMLCTDDVISIVSYQIHIPIWSDLNQFHHPQIGKLKTACNLSDMHIAPLPGKFKNKDDYQKIKFFFLLEKKRSRRKQSQCLFKVYIKFCTEGDEGKMVLVPNLNYLVINRVSHIHQASF